MPTLLDLTEIKMDWLDSVNRVHHPYPESHVRSSGVHLSGVIRYVAQEAGILEKPGIESTSTSAIRDVDEEEMPLRMMLGQWFEEGCVSLYPDICWQPGEYCLNDIFGSPDGLTFDFRAGRLRIPILLEEFKLTWKSEFNYGKPHQILVANWLWMSQLKGYLRMLSAIHDAECRIARLHVGWVNGDYRPPQPKIMRYLIEFTQSEIDRFWDGVAMKNRDNPGVVKEIH